VQQYQNSACALTLLLRVPELAAVECHNMTLIFSPLTCTSSVAHTHHTLGEQCALPEVHLSCCHDSIYIRGFNCTPAQCESFFLTKCLLIFCQN